MLKSVLDILQGISIIIASFSAIISLHAWRREAKWKRKYELAEEVLSLFYDIKDKILLIRSPLAHPEEGKIRPKKEGETQNEKSILDNAYVPFERYNLHKETFQKLFSIKYRFMAVFGKSYSAPFDEITKIINEILNAARMLGTHYWQRQGTYFRTDAEQQKHLEGMNKYESKIWFEDETKDEISMRVSAAIEQIETFFSQINKP